MRARTIVSFAARSARRVRSPVLGPTLTDEFGTAIRTAAQARVEDRHQVSSPGEAVDVEAPGQGGEPPAEGLDRPATAEDIHISFELFHGRAAEPQVVHERTGQPLELILAGAIGSEEFETMVVRPVTERRPPHATLNLPSSVDDRSPLFGDLGLDPTELRKAQGPADVLKALHAAPAVRALLQAFYAPERLVDFKAGLAEVCGAPESQRQAHEKAPPAPLAVVRASMLRLEKALAPIFGPERLTPALLGQIARAVSQAERSGTLLSERLGPVLAARYMLMRTPGEGLDYGRLETQVAVVAELCFSQADDLDRAALETRALNRARQTAIATPLYTPIAGAPPFTLAMACAAHLRHGVFTPARLDEEAMAALHEFYDENLLRFSFERYLTPPQRAFMRARRAAAAAGPRTPWATVELDGTALQGFQVQVTDAETTPRLSIPASLAEFERPAAWLAEVVRDGLEGEPLDQRGLAPFALSYLAGRSFTPVPPLPIAHPPARGRKPLRLGDRVTFNEAGEGRRHLVGNGWWQGEATHTWSGRHTALLAFHLAKEDAGPLDLHLRLMTGPHPEGLVNLYWNGALVGRLRPVPSYVQSAQVHLGRQHRSGPAANILCIEVDHLFTPIADPRRLGVALCDLTFVAR